MAPKEEIESNQFYNRDRVSSPENSPCLRIMQRTDTIPMKIRFISKNPRRPIRRTSKLTICVSVTAMYVKKGG